MEASTSVDIATLLQRERNLMTTGTQLEQKLGQAQERVKVLERELEENKRQKGALLSELQRMEQMQKELRRTEAARKLMQERLQGRDRLQVEEASEINNASGSQSTRQVSCQGPNVGAAGNPSGPISDISIVDRADHISTRPATMGGGEAATGKRPAEVTAGGGGGKRQRPPDISYVIARMMKAKGDPAKLWYNVLDDTWKKLYPSDEPMPDTLWHDTDWEAILDLVRDMCPSLNDENLKERLDTHGRELFPTKNFLKLNFTPTTAKHITQGSGLLHVIAKALDTEVSEITNTANREKWRAT